MYRSSQRCSINLAFLKEFWGIFEQSRIATRINKTSVLRRFIMEIHTLNCNSTNSWNRCVSYAYLTRPKASDLLHLWPTCASKWDFTVLYSKVSRVMHERAIPSLLLHTIQPTLVANVFGLWHQEIVMEDTSKKSYKSERTNILEVMNKTKNCQISGSVQLSD